MNASHGKPPSLAYLAAGAMLVLILAPTALAASTPASISQSARSEINKGNWMAHGQKGGRPAYLLNCGPSVYCPKLISGGNQYVNSDGSLTVCGYGQAYCGQCATFTQVVSGAARTSSWAPGSSVLSAGVPSGAIIATFGADGRYPASGNHAAILVSYERDSSGRIVGIWVVDQNYVAPNAVGYHFLPVSGSQVQYQSPTTANGYWSVYY